MVIAGKRHQSKGRRNYLTPPVAVQPCKSPMKTLRKQPGSKAALRKTKGQQQSLEHPVTITVSQCHA